MCVCVCVCVCVCARARAPCRCAGTLVAGAVGTGGIYSSAATVGRPRVQFAFCAICWSRALAAGSTFTSRTTSAQWAARLGHTSVVDAAGAIYVIGGSSGVRLGCISCISCISCITAGQCQPAQCTPDYSNFYRDVWVSTDRGADRTKSAAVEGVLGGYLGCSRGTRGNRGGTWGVLRCTKGKLRGGLGVPRVYTIPKGALRATEYW